MHIVMIGPVYPYKGGIAHYTAMMSKHLAKNHKITNISFSFQYPKALYKRSQKDHSNDTFKIDGTQYLIHTLNPFNWVAVARAINNMQPDAVIFQWWHPYFAPCYWMISSLLKKHIKVITLCHNVLPHEGFPAKRLLTKKALKRSNAYIVHSQPDLEDLQSLIANPRVIKTVIPTFNAFKFTNLSYTSARSKLGLAETDEVLLFFGYIREYKGLKHLIRALPDVLKKRPNIKVLIVGDFFENNKTEYVQLMENNGCMDSIILVDGYTPDDEVEQYFMACDVVVLPYDSATQSGIVQIAYSFEKPVIATKVGGLPEVVLDEQTGILVKPKCHDALADAILYYFEEKKGAEFSQNVKSEAYKYDWDRMTETVDTLLQQ